MNTITFRFLLILGFVSFCQTSIAQSGFIGMKNSVDLDLAKISSGSFNFCYKLSYSKRASMMIDFGYQHKHSDAFGTNTQDIDRFTPEASYNGFLAGIGILWNSKHAGLNMPIGYYGGFSLDLMKGYINNFIAPGKYTTTVSYSIANPSYYFADDKTDIYTNKSQINFKFKGSGYSFSTYVGKNSYIAKNICLDINLRFGFQTMTYKASESIKYPVSALDYSISQPKHVGDPLGEVYIVKSDDVYYCKESGFNMLETNSKSPFYSVASNLQSQTFKYTPSTSIRISTLKLIFYPQIKIGYLF